MDEIQIFLNTEDPVYKNLQIEITRYLESLESISYTQTKQAPPEGTLSGIDLQTLNYYVSIAANSAKFVAAIIVIYQQISAAQKKSPKEKSSKNALVLKVSDLELSLPATHKAIDTFLKAISPQSSPPTSKAKSKTKKARKN